MAVTKLKIKCVILSVLMFRITFIIALALTYAIIARASNKVKERQWHAYNTSLITGSQGSKKNCTSYFESTRPYPPEFVDKLELWKGLMNDFDVEHGETLYGSRQALEAIYANQNPPDCLKAKYLISSGWPYGFGSRIHMEGFMLAVAMQLGRVFMIHPDGDNIFWETQVPFCQQNNEYNRQWTDTSLNCFYAPMSKCTMTQALEGTGGDVNHVPSFNSVKFVDIFDSEEARQAMINSLKDTKAFTVDLTTAIKNNDNRKHPPMVPFSMFPILECSPLRVDAYLYWWRTVSATYIARPNHFAVQALAKYGASVSLGDTKKCIGMFVRHGDKGIEMKLIDFKVYRDTAVLMWEQGYVPRVVNGDTSSGSSAADNGTLFITTEDPQVLEEAEAWGKVNHWDIQYTNLFDRSIQTAYKTWDQQHAKGTKAVHDNLEYISMMLNLELALKCDTWVCTLASNSCRLIDELRCTVGGKCNRFYADLSGETCVNPPCIDGSSQIYSFGDRRRRF